MSYYKTLGAVFVIMIASVVVQGKELFSDVFFIIAYAVMGLVLVIGTKFENRSSTALSMGMILILTVGFLSTVALAELFTSGFSMHVFFKLAISFSLDGCALFFFYYGRKLRGMEGMKHGFGQHEAYKEQFME